MDNYDGYDPNHDRSPKSEEDFSLRAVLARHPEVVKWTVAILVALLTVTVVHIVWTRLFHLPFMG